MPTVIKPVVTLVKALSMVRWPTSMAYSLVDKTLSPLLGRMEGASSRLMVSTTCVEFGLIRVDGASLAGMLCSSNNSEGRAMTLITVG